MTPGSPRDRQTNHTAQIVRSPKRGGAHLLARKAATRSGCHVPKRAARLTSNSPPRHASARYGLNGTVTYTSRAPAQHHVLRAGWHSRQRGLERPQRRQRPWKNKKKVSADDLESSASQQPSCARCRQRLRIPVEWDAAHDESGPWIPGIVFPECEIPAGRQRAADARERAT